MRKCVALLALVLAMGLIPMGALAAENDTVGIPVEIRLDGAVPDGAEVFTIELKAADGICDYTTIRGGSTGEIRIPCDRLGTYYYTIRQIAGSNPDCTYDARKYQLCVQVLMEDGEKQVSVILTDGNGFKVDTVCFRNRYAYPAWVNLSAQKTLDGKTPKDGAFAFRLIGEDGSLIFEVENDGRQVNFPAMEFDTVGTYRYFLKEVKGDDGRIVYDRTVYTVTVEVTKDTDYRAQVRWERNGKAYSGVPVFRNFTDTGNAKTGDSIGIYVAGLILSGAGLVSLGVLKKRRK